MRLIRVEVGPTAEKRFTMWFVELMRVLFQKRCKRGVHASIFIILLFVLVGLKNSHWIVGSRSISSDFFFWVEEIGLRLW